MNGLRNSNLKPAARVINITTILHRNYHYTLQNELAGIELSVCTLTYQLPVTRL